MLIVSLAGQVTALARKAGTATYYHIPNIIITMTPADKATNHPLFYTI